MKEILKQVIHNKPHIHIGKAGITEAVIDQINLQFKSKKLLKIKFLSFDNLENIIDSAQYISNLTKSKVMDTRGKTCVLMSKSKN